MTPAAARAPSDAERDGSAPVLALRGFGVAYGKKVVIAEIDLALAPQGVQLLVGPSGTGKSTLLRTLCGQTQANPSLRCWGSAEYAGEPLGLDRPLPELVAQSARLMIASVFENLVCNLPGREKFARAEQRERIVAWLHEQALESLLPRLEDPVVTLSLAMQRHIAVIRAVASDPPLLCLDEPTANLEEDEAQRLIAHLLRESRHRALLITTHQQSHARRLGGRLALLAGGRIQEHRATDEFFAGPHTAAGREFVATGNCRLPAPDADPEGLAEDVPPPPPLPPSASSVPLRASGPHGFLWVRPGRLAGTPLPGVFHDRDYDLAALRRVGIRHLVNLTEQEMPADALAPYGLRSHWFPVVDMTPPSLEQAQTICLLLDRLIAADEPVAVHCRAGLGRTGTVLAMHLIWSGRDAVDALETVRRVEPRWVQSDAQVLALEAFSDVCATRRAHAARAQTPRGHAQGDREVPPG